MDRQVPNIDWNLQPHSGKLWTTTRLYFPDLSTRIWTFNLSYPRTTYCSIPSPNSSSPSSSSSSPAGSPNSSDSSSNGGRSRPGLDVIGSPRRLLEPRDGLVAVEKGSDEVSSYNENIIIKIDYRNVRCDVTARTGWQRSHHCHPSLNCQTRRFLQEGMEVTPALIFVVN